MKMAILLGPQGDLALWSRSSEGLRLALHRPRPRHRISEGCAQKLLGMNEQVGRYHLRRHGQGALLASCAARLCLVPAVPGPPVSPCAFPSSFLPCPPSGPGTGDSRLACVTGTSRHFPLLGQDILAPFSLPLSV